MVGGDHDGHPPGPRRRTRAAGIDRRRCGHQPVVGNGRRRRGRRGHRQRHHLDGLAAAQPRSRTSSGPRCGSRATTPASSASGFSSPAGLRAAPARTPSPTSSTCATEHPDVYAATTTFLEPKDYLNLRLTGKQAASFDSIALHWVTDNRDPNAVAYDDELLGFAGLSRDQLPELRPATDVLGGSTAAAAADLGLPADLPVVMGTPDVHSAGIGAGTTADLSAHLYIGTSSWLTCHVPVKKTDLIHNIATLPGGHPRPLPGRQRAGDGRQGARLARRHPLPGRHGSSAPSTPT